ncbi:unnamed protein product [Owenia fusiformis]|uniref:Uncharacterized protein n=1 Tax=Owenia fusiformis TaxID=6347 RepID=A0A8S4N0V4_OWEFU|nr:unnamed protein product [Owenia fusiformis]
MLSKMDSTHYLTRLTRLLTILTIFVTLGTSSVIITNNAITVKIGRAVFIDPKDLTFTPTDTSTVCKVRVVTNDPITQKVGRIHPQMFDCQFGPQTVEYRHSGNPHLTKDTVRLEVIHTTSTGSSIETFLIEVNILKAPYNVFVIDPRFKPLTVDNFYGTSNPIDSSVVRFNYDTRSDVSCRVMYSRFITNYPMQGQLVLGTQKRITDSFKKNCRDFLFKGYQYEHLAPPTPDVDYIPLTVEVHDPSVSSEPIIEQYFLPVRIQGAFPNVMPKASYVNSYIMDVDEFQVTTIDPKVISAKDSETPEEKLVFNLSKPFGPGEGHLVHDTDHSTPIFSFTQEELMNNNIAYKPPNQRYTERKDYSVELTVYDSSFTSSEPITLHVAVHPSNSHVPHVLINKPLIIVEGQSQMVSQDTIQLEKDTVILSVKGGLNHGQLTVNGQPAMRFTAGNIRAREVFYTHDGSDTLTDHIALRITDGNDVLHETIHVTILPLDDSPPYVLKNLGLKLKASNTAPISPNILSARDLDSEDCEIKFIITRPPRFGEIQKTYRPMTVGRHNSDFTQDDLNNGYIYYKHYGDEEYKDNILFKLQDHADPPNESNEYMFKIEIIPINDKPPMNVPDMSQQIIVKETDVATIRKKDLEYTDVESDPSDLVYTVVTQPYYLDTRETIDGGRLIYIANTKVPVIKNNSIPPVYFFTQREINQGKIAYMPPLEDIGPNPKRVRFEYAVSDQADNRIIEQVFDIIIKPVNNQPPDMSTQKLISREGGSVRITTNEISAFDVDTPLAELIFKLEFTPQHGQITMGNRPLEEGEQFSLIDLMDQKQSFRYFHDGSESKMDMFGLTVSDGIHQLSKVISILIKPINDQKPWLPEDLQSELTVLEGDEVAITTDNILAHDNDTEPESLSFVIVRHPIYGEILHKSGGRINQFSLNDVEEELVVYKHRGDEIGPENQEDSMTIMVTDQAAGYLGANPLYDLNFQILPVNNQRPNIVPGPPMFVNEGEKVKITDEDLSALDRDTKAGDLVFKITKQPEWGIIENSALNDIDGKSVREFRMIDILNGEISYIQSNHTGFEPQRDSFDVYVHDGQLTSPIVSISITIIPQNDETPELDVENLIITEGSEKMIDPGMIKVRDDDIPNQILTLSVDTTPRHGKLMLMHDHGRGMVEMALHDVDLEELQKDVHLVYKHDGSENFNDVFTLKVTDGKHEVKKSSTVRVTPINDEKPKVVKNMGLYIQRGGSGLISNSVLQTNDNDTPDNETYIILTETPKRGVLQYRMDAIPALLRTGGYNEPDTFWREVNVGTNFTQEDINRNRIRYTLTNQIEETTSDQFRFKVTDGNNYTPDEYFDIEIINSRRGGLGMHSRILKVRERDTAIISNAYLSASDEISPSELIEYFVTKPTSQGWLSFNTEPSKSITNFTQQDIQAEKLIYTHNSKADITTDFFYFLVKNSLNEKQNGTFYIEIETVDEAQPSLITNVPLVAYQDTYTVITSSNLAVSDPDSDISLLFYHINRHTHFGKLYNRGIMVKENFTQYDIDNGYITYKTDDENADMDHFVFTVSDPNNNGFLKNGTLQLRPVMFSILIHSIKNFRPIMRVNKKPDMLESMPLGRFGYIISSRFLQAEDADTKTSNLQYVITKMPQHGVLENVISRRQVKRKFTQKDINDGNIAYVIKDGAKETNDSFIFKVQDTKKNVLLNQKFTLEWSSIQFISATYMVCENIGSLSLGIVRTGAMDQTVFVSLKTRSMTAKNGRDFEPSRTIQIQFDPGDAMVNWDVTIIEDDLDEESEKFKVSLKAPVNAMLGQNDKTTIEIINAKYGECPEYIGMISKDHPHLPMQFIPHAHGTVNSKTSTILLSMINKTITGDDDNGKEKTNTDGFEKEDAEIKQVGAINPELANLDPYISVFDMKPSAAEPTKQPTKRKKGKGKKHRRKHAGTDGRSRGKRKKGKGKKRKEKVKMPEVEPATFGELDEAQNTDEHTIPMPHDHPNFGKHETEAIDSKIDKKDFDIFKAGVFTGDPFTEEMLPEVHTDKFDRDMVSTEADLNEDTTEEDGVTVETGDLLPTAFPEYIVTQDNPKNVKIPIHNFETIENKDFLDFNTPTEVDEKKKKTKKKGKGKKKMKTKESKSILSQNDMKDKIQNEQEINAPQSCNEATKGLLHFDFTTQRLFRCSGVSWLPWHASHIDQPQASDSRVIQCEQGWSVYNSVCYRVFSIKKEWNEAEKICQVEHGGHLASVTSEKHLHWLAKLANKNMFWIGLNDKRELKQWEYTSENEVTYMNWRRGFPRNKQVFHKNCVLVLSSQKWVNRPCVKSKAPYICSKK